MKSCKATLLRMLDGLGQYEGIDCYRTPGEEAAVRMAMKLVEGTPLKELDKIAALSKKVEPFWSKQW